jgi:hypothetical protein
MLVRMWRKGTLIHYWWECKLEQPLWKTIWRLLKKLSIDLPYDPAIPSLGIYLNKCDTGYSRGTCTPMFIAALFLIAKLWKQPRCPTTDEWIKKMWYLYTVKFYSAMKKNKILSFTSKWIELENIILNEVSQAQKAKNSSPSYVDFTPKTNAIILLDLGHMLRGRTHTGEIGKSRKPKT